MLSSSDTSAELMELCKAEPFGIFHHHHRRIRHVDTDLHDCRRDEYLDFSAGEPLHDLVFLRRLHLSVQHLYCDARQLFFQELCIVGDVFRFQTLALLHHRADHIRLTAQFDLTRDKAVSFWTVRRIHHTVFDRQTLRRKFINHRNRKISVQNDSQGSWNRRCTHNENIRRFPFFSKCRSLPDTEAVLFVCDDKRQIFVLYLFLNQCMCADHHFAASVFQTGIDFPAFFCFRGSSQKAGIVSRQIVFFQQSAERFIMLPRQNLRRNHQRRLVAVLSCHNHCKECQNRLSASDISLYQPRHAGMAF